MNIDDCNSSIDGLSGVGFSNMRPLAASHQGADDNLKPWAGYQEQDGVDYQQHVRRVVGFVTSFSTFDHTVIYLLDLFQPHKYAYLCIRGHGMLTC